jgi:hypothetical protein
VISAILVDGLLVGGSSGPLTGGLYSLDIIFTVICYLTITNNSGFEASSCRGLSVLRLGLDRFISDLLLANHCIMCVALPKGPCYLKSTPERVFLLVGRFDTV